MYLTDRSSPKKIAQTLLCFRSTHGREQEINQLTSWWRGEEEVGDGGGWERNLVRSSVISKKGAGGDFYRGSSANLVAWARQRRCGDPKRSPKFVNKNLWRECHDAISRSNFDTQPNIGQSCCGEPNFGLAISG
jgi:hypothetical protein